MRNPFDAMANLRADGSGNHLTLDAHRTHLPAAKMLTVSRVRSASATEIAATRAGFPALGESADRKLMEVAQ
jgi:hypothetical protein